jgi:hypothetical protein
VEARRTIRARAECLPVSCARHVCKLQVPRLSFERTVVTWQAICDARQGYRSCTLGAGGRMGHKPSNAYQMNRPESGGADRDAQLERSGLLERDKQEFAARRNVRQAAQQRPPEKAQGELPARNAAEHETEPGADPASGTARRD